ncbi:MAG: hypothetical protein ABJ056_10335 [Halioglobus sp.]
MSDKPRRRIEPEMLVGVSAVFIGVCALVVSLYEASIMRAEQRSSVLPLLEISRSHFIDEDKPEAEWRLEIHAENVGIGPATVRDFRVTVDGKPQKSWAQAIGVLLDSDAEVVYWQSTINGRTLPAERVITMFGLRDRELAEEVVSQFDRLDFEACYCSVFDECWVTSYKRFGGADPVEACEPGAHSFSQ